MTDTQRGSLTMIKDIVILRTALVLEVICLAFAFCIIYIDRNAFGAGYFLNAMYLVVLAVVIAQFTTNKRYYFPIKLAAASLAAFLPFHPVTLNLIGFNLTTDDDPLSGLFFFAQVLVIYIPLSLLNCLSGVMQYKMRKIASATPAHETAATSLLES